MNQKPSSLQLAIDKALEDYFNHLEGEVINGVHNMLMEEVECQLIRYAYKRYKNNQTHCAQALGISRMTLRTKLKHYQLID